MRTMMVFFYFIISHHVMGEPLEGPRPTYRAHNHGALQHPPQHRNRFQEVGHNNEEYDLSTYINPSIKQVMATTAVLSAFSQISGSDFVKFCTVLYVSKDQIVNIVRSSINENGSYLKVPALVIESAIVCRSFYYFSSSNFLQNLIFDVVGAGALQGIANYFYAPMHKDMISYVNLVEKICTWTFCGAIGWESFERFF